MTWLRLGVLLLIGASGCLPLVGTLGPGSASDAAQSPVPASDVAQKPVLASDAALGTPQLIKAAPSLRPMASAQPRPSASPSLPAYAAVPFGEARELLYSVSLNAGGIPAIQQLGLGYFTMGREGPIIKVQATETINGSSRKSDYWVNRGERDPWSLVTLVNTAAIANMPTTSREETITVPAGTFACTRISYVALSIYGSGTLQRWLSTDRELIKQVSSIQVADPSKLPPRLLGTGKVLMTPVLTTSIELTGIRENGDLTN